MKKWVLGDFVKFNDRVLSAKYKYAQGEHRISMSELIDAYINGKVDIPGDLGDFLRKKDLFVKYSLMTPLNMRGILTHFVPEIAQAFQNPANLEHPRRGNNFYHKFLGKRMLYTAGFFNRVTDSLEEAQDKKMDLICQKLQLKKGDRYLDIGCGWGTMTLYSAMKYGVESTGVTAAKSQMDYGNEQILKANASKKAQIFCLDYQKIPRKKYSKISCLGLSEQIGMKNFNPFMKKVYNLLEDQGLCYLQVTGLRAGLHFEGCAWSLFMNQYISPSQHPGIPLSTVLNQLEKTGFEVHSVENIGIHYALTLQHWYNNWVQNRFETIRSCGEPWFRTWHLFLGWSVQMAAQGQSTYFQIVCHKNLNSFNRRIWIKDAKRGEDLIAPVFSDFLAPSTNLDPRLGLA